MFDIYFCKALLWFIGLVHYYNIYYNNLFGF